MNEMFYQTTGRGASDRCPTAERMERDLSKRLDDELFKSNQPTNIRMCCSAAASGIPRSAGGMIYIGKKATIAPSDYSTNRT